jgi:hypothetical protein
MNYLKSNIISTRNQLLYDPIEQKVREATSNTPAKNPEQLRKFVAEATNNYEHFLLIMQTLWKRMESRQKDWRHVYKALLLILYAIVHGHDRVYADLKVSPNRAARIEPLLHFEYVDETDGKDYGEAVRALADRVLKFIDDEELVMQCRQQAARGEFPGFTSDGTIKTGLTPRGKNITSPSSNTSTPVRRVENATNRPFESVHSDYHDSFNTPPPPPKRQVSIQSVEKKLQNDFDLTSPFQSPPIQSPPNFFVSPQVKEVPDSFVSPQVEVAKPLDFGTSNSNLQEEIFETDFESPQITPIKQDARSSRRVDLPLDLPLVEELKHKDPVIFTEQIDYEQQNNQQAQDQQQIPTLSEIEQLRLELKQAKEQIIQLQIKNVDLEKEILIASNRTTNELFIENDILRRQLSASVGEIEEVRQKARSIIAKNEEQTQAEIAKYQQEIDQLRQKLSADESDKDARVVQLNFETEQLRLQLNTVSEDLNQAIRTRDENMDMVRHLNRVNESLSQANNKLTTETEELRQQVNDMSLQLNNVTTNTKGENEIKDKEIENLKQKLATMEEELEKVITARDNALESSRQLTEQLATIQEEKQCAVEQAEMQKVELEQANNTVSELKVANEKLTNDYNELSTISAREREQLEQENKNINKRLEEQENNLRKLQERLDEKSSEIDELKRVIEALQNTVNQLNHTILGKEEEIRSYETKLAQVKQERDQFEHTVSELKHRVEDSIQNLAGRVKDLLLGARQEIVDF